MQGIYDILCLALLEMALASFCFTLGLSTLLVRKQFAQRTAHAPLQRRITRGLQFVLLTCLLTWLVALLWGATAAARAILQGELVPLLFLLFSPLFSSVVSFLLFRKTLRVRIRDTAALESELQRLSSLTVATLNTQEAVGAQAALKASRSSPTVRKKAMRAVLLLGAPSYAEVLKLFQSQAETSSHISMVN